MRRGLEQVSSSRARITILFQVLNQSKPWFTKQNWKAVDIFQSSKLTRWRSADFISSIAMFVKGYSATRNESSPLEWHVDFPVGYHQPLKAKMAEYSGEEWNELYGVEITADFGEDALDWEFCIDDLEIMFFQKSQDREVGFVSGHEQNVLKDE